ncbi:hypothetical protein ACFW3E_38330, partial [Streptomyces sp. NPDC058861]
LLAHSPSTPGAAGQGEDPRGTDKRTGLKGLHKLSALYGLLPLDQVIVPYDHTWEDEGSITVDDLQAQADGMGLTGADVVLLTPGKYTQRAIRVWPNAQTPLAHMGIGRQRGRLTALREGARTSSAHAA